MKYLVIGDSNSMHIYNFTKNFLIPHGYEIHLLTLSNKPIREEYMRFYRENGVTVHSIAEKKYKGFDKNTRFYRILNLIRKIRLMNDVPKVDICHLHSVYKTSVVMALLNKKKFKKLILSYWGGDLLELSKGILWVTRKALRLADVVTVTVKQSVIKFQNVYGNEFDSKLRICRFATAGLDCIKTLSETVSRKDCRESYGIPDDKICITAGYSAYREQHQERCLEEIQKLPKDIRKRLFVIVPMQYGRMNDKAYFERVEKAKQNVDFDCVILREFVPFEMSARLAVATDIYLHLRDTDAFSNALKEHVFSGSQLITGTWLKYPELEEMGAPVTSIDSFDELTETLEKQISDFKIENNIKLFDPIFELYASEKIIEQWDQVIDLAVK